VTFIPSHTRYSESHGLTPLHPCRNSQKTLLHSSLFCTDKITHRGTHSLLLHMHPLQPQKHHLHNPRRRPRPRRNVQKQVEWGDCILSTSLTKRVSLDIVYSQPSDTGTGNNVNTQLVYAVNHLKVSVFEFVTGITHTNIFYLVYTQPYAPSRYCHSHKYTP